MKLPELKSKPIKGVPEEEWHLWTIKREVNAENLKLAQTSEAQEKRKASNYNSQWKESRRKYLTNRKRPDHSEAMKGKGNSMYGSGNKYIELTSGFIGYASDMEEKFGVYKGNIASHAKKDRPLKQGKFKGLHFQIYQP